MANARTASQKAPTARTGVVVIGAGISGSWLAYRLAQRNVPVVVVAADDYFSPLSHKAAGIIDQRVLDCDPATAPEVFADASTTQSPALQQIMVEQVRAQFNDLSELVGYGTKDQFVAPCVKGVGSPLGAGARVVGAVLSRFRELGGTVLRGRVTDLVVDGDTCRGVHFERDGMPGVLSCNEVVFASGGFCGMFADGVGDNTGYLLGTYARHGGRLANLEFFNHLPLGDLDSGWPLYPFDLVGARLFRAGDPAIELTEATAKWAGHDVDMDVFRNYWMHNYDVPHTAVLADRTVSIGPVKGFAMGGIAHSLSTGSISNVHATGECRYGLSVDSLNGKPFASYLVMSAELADELVSTMSPTEDLAISDVPPTTDSTLIDEVRQRVDLFQNARFSVDIAQEFIRWCEITRARLLECDRTDTEAADLLVLAEAYGRSVTARRESRGFFYRPDFPDTDPGFDNIMTVAAYDCGTNQVRVSLVTVDK